MTSFETTPTGQLARLLKLLSDKLRDRHTLAERADALMKEAAEYEESLEKTEQEIAKLYTDLRVKLDDVDLT